MSSETPLLQTLAARQERMLHLAAGTELRCRSGCLQLRFTIEPAGTALSLVTGQAVRIPATQAVLVTAATAAQMEVRGGAGFVAPSLQARAQKNRQGLAGLWRWCAERALIRRGTRAA